jgi:hypothetical protein
MKRLTKREKQGFQDNIPVFDEYPPLTQVCVSKEFDKWVRKQYEYGPRQEIVKFLSFYYYDDGLTRKRAFIFLGEIPNMKGHGVYMDFEGKGHWGYHCDQFQATDGEDCWSSRHEFK